MEAYRNPIIEIITDPFTGGVRIHHPYGDPRIHFQYAWKKNNAYLGLGDNYIGYCPSIIAYALGLHDRTCDLVDWAKERIASGATVDDNLRLSIKEMFSFHLADLADDLNSAKDFQSLNQVLRFINKIRGEKSNAWMTQVGAGIHALENIYFDTFNVESFCDLAKEMMLIEANHNTCSRRGMLGTSKPIDFNQAIISSKVFRLAINCITIRVFIDLKYRHEHNIFLHPT